MWKFGIDLSNLTVWKIHELVRCFWGHQLGLCLMVTGWTSTTLCFGLGFFFFFKHAGTEGLGLALKKYSECADCGLWQQWEWLGDLMGMGVSFFKGSFFLSLAVDGVSRLSWRWCLCIHHSNAGDGVEAKWVYYEKAGMLLKGLPVRSEVWCLCGTGISAGSGQEHGRWWFFLV